MKTRVLALLGVLIVAGAVAFGVNTALGDPPTPEIIPGPPPDSTPAPPPAWLMSALQTGKARFAVPPQPIPDTINGREIPATFGATVSNVILTEPGYDDDRANVWVVVVGESWVALSAEGLVDSEVQPQDAEALAPLLEALPPDPTPPRLPSPEPPGLRPEELLPPDAPRWQPDSVTINGKEVPLPEGATAGVVISTEPGPLTPDWLLHDGHMFVDLGESIVLFTYDGIFLHSRIEPQDAEALAPIMRELSLSIKGKLIPFPPGAAGQTVINVPGSAAPAGWPSAFMEITLGSSWVKFTPDDGILLDSRIEPKDAEALQPLMRELTPP